MPVPTNLNSDLLYPYCELSATREDGTKVDFTGVKTYSIGFLREGLGFGITDIRIDISPSMQPIIEINFKDFYGNLAFTNDKNRETLINEAGKTDINEYDFKSIFDLPYPKFELTLKGYLGGPVKFLLNVKKINVALVASDGSFEIKATFVPNIYGFFADLPYYYLNAVKSFRIAGFGRNKEAIAKQLQSNESLSDIKQVGTLVQQDIATIQDSVGPLKGLLLALQDNTDDIYNIDWFAGIKGESYGGENLKSFGFTDLQFNIKHIVNGINNANLNLDDASRLRAFKANPGDRKIVRDALVASLTKSPNPSPIYDLWTKVSTIQEIQKGEKLIEDNLKAIENFTNSKILRGSEEKLKQITIGNVFDTLIKDSAYLMGKILEAAYRGYKIDKSNRDSNDKLIGKYFPFQQNDKGEQEPYDGATIEKQFVQNFIRALTEGVVEAVRKGVDQSNPTPTGVQNKLNKRISNAELLSTNPYVKTNAEKFIQYMFERSAIAANFMFVTSRYSTDDLESLINSEFSNLEDGIKTLGDGDKLTVSNFCNNLVKFIDKDGNIRKDDNTIFTITSSNDVELIKNLNVKVSDGNQAISTIINQYIGGIIGMDTNTYKSKSIIHNGLLYTIPKYTNGSTVYIMFKKSDNDPGLFDNADSTKPYDDNDFDIIEVDNDAIHDDTAFQGTFIDRHINEEYINVNGGNGPGLMLDYKKLSRVSLGDVNDIYFRKNLKENEDAPGKYYYALYLQYEADIHSVQQYVFNLFGNTNAAVRQRKILSALCSRYKIGAQKDEEEKKQKIKETITQLQENGDIFYTQFHHLTNNWMNLLSTANINSTTGIAELLQDYFVNKQDKNNSVSNVIYEIPLQTIQNKTGTINLKNAIVNIEPLFDDNSNTTVLNVMGNICHKNNFMFLSIPGNGYDKENGFDADKIFQPYIGDVNNVKAMNLFYVIFMPTPENRTSFNNKNSIYNKFEPTFKRKPFEIDFGSVNNTIVKRIDLTTEDNKVTAESAIAISRMVDNQNTNKIKSLDCSSLSIMEGRSYKIKGEIIGNAQISPTMFFVINKTPIFNGLYQIMKVSHDISKNIFVTTFEAIKMKFAGDKQDFIMIPPITLESLQSNTRVVSDNTIPLRNAATTEHFGIDDLINSIKPDQQRHLDSLHPDVKKRFTDFINAIQEKTGYVVVITSSYRSWAEQATLKAQNNKNAAPGYSLHNYGMALDINLQNGLQLLKKDTSTQLWKASGALDIADQLNLRWGGNFSGYEDRVHFDVGNEYDSNVLRQKAIDQYGNNPSLVKGNEINLA